MERLRTEWDLGIGETLQIGPLRLTLVDVEEDAVCLHVENIDSEDDDLLPIGGLGFALARPR